MSGEQPKLTEQKCAVCVRDNRVATAELAFANAPSATPLSSDCSVSLRNYRHIPNLFYGSEVKCFRALNPKQGDLEKSSPIITMHFRVELDARIDMKDDKIRRILSKAR